MAKAARLLDQNLPNLRKGTQVLYFYGPAQSGKTSAVKRALAGTDVTYVNLGEVATFERCRNNPERFLRKLPTPVVVDEVERVPALVTHILAQADQILRDGERQDISLEDHLAPYILIGNRKGLVSHKIPKLPTHLIKSTAILPLSASEDLGAPTTVLGALYDQRLQTSKKRGFKSFAAAIPYTTFPEVSGKASHLQKKWFEAYLRTTFNDKKAFKVARPGDLEILLKVLAHQVGASINDARSAEEMDLHLMAIRRYRTVLERLGLIMPLQPWLTKGIRGIVHRPRLYFTDTALLCYALKLEVQAIPDKQPREYAPLFKNFVYTELMKSLSVMDDTHIGFFKTHTTREIDFMIQRGNGQMLGIMVKAGDAVTGDDFVPLQSLRTLAGPDFVRGIVIYEGEEVQDFGNNMFAVPVSFLWRLDNRLIWDGEVHYDNVNLYGWHFWVRYGEATMIRGVIPHGTLVSTHNPDEGRLEIRRNWKHIWQMFTQKVTRGEMMHIKHYNHGTDVDVLEVRLDSVDKGVRNSNASLRRPEDETVANVHTQTATLDQKEDVSEGLQRKRALLQKILQTPSAQLKNLLDQAFDKKD